MTVLWTTNTSITVLSSHFNPKYPSQKVNQTLHLERIPPSPVPGVLYECGYARKGVSGGHTLRGRAGVGYVHINTYKSFLTTTKPPARRPSNSLIYVAFLINTGVCTSYKPSTRDCLRQFSCRSLLTS